MRAVWYDRPGPASEVLRAGELPDPEPGPGEVRVRLTRSGVNPGDTKKRADWVGYGMPYPRIIPHSDGAGKIDAVGPGIDPVRVGRRVWVYGAQSYRAFGTAAQLTVVPDSQAVDLPDGVSDDVGAALGIPGITAHRAVFADGPVTGQTVLVHVVLGGVGALAAQLAAWGGATVIGAVRKSGELAHAVALDGPDPAAAIREDRPTFPFWPMLFGNVVIRLIGSDDFPVEAKRQATADLTAAAAEGALSVVIGDPLPLERVAEAHDRVDAGTRERVLLAIPE